MTYRDRCPGRNSGAYILHKGNIHTTTFVLHDAHIDSPLVHIYRTLRRKPLSRSGYQPGLAYQDIGHTRKALEKMTGGALNVDALQLGNS
ncbi:hypothetical protein Hypma_003739 [Hypsizygus marmoreus]|uniref:Uncharacterized protein n=1 Tax=Hypsizygus marmoreus TaxID=39966 RepID=A0A369J602_HYPMA|nr:hypothetical protein Hypma_003739 [Hypsizygus marmoreus]